MKKFKWKSVLTLAIALLFVVQSGPVMRRVEASEPPAYSANLVLDLRFEDNLDCGAGNNVTTLTGDPVFVDGVDGIGRAMNLAGNRTLNLGTHERLNPLTGLTASFWFRPNTVMTGETIFIWTKGNFDSAGWYIGSPSNSQSLIFSSGPGGAWPFELIVSGADFPRDQFFPVNEWTHIAVSFEQSTGTGRIYRNGVEIIARAGGASATIVNTDVPRYIARNGSHGANNLMNGHLDDFLVFDAPLSLVEIIDIYEEKRDFEGQFAELLNLDREALSLPSRTMHNLTLPSAGANGSTITWASSNTDVITDEGVVTPPDYGEVLVTMTATLTLRDSGPITRDFTVIVFSEDFTPMVLQDAGTENVTLRDPFLLNAERQNIDQLLALEPLRFLAHFYDVAGLPRPGPSATSPTGALPYQTIHPPGQSGDNRTPVPEWHPNPISWNTWERSDDMNFRGHMFGHYMSSLAMAYNAFDGDPEVKDQIVARLRECLIELQRLQAATYNSAQHHRGYIGPFGDIRLSHNPNANNRHNVIDNMRLIGGAPGMQPVSEPSVPNNDAAAANINPPFFGLEMFVPNSNPPVRRETPNQGGRPSDNVFVPWYNLHKVYVGLIDMHKYMSGVSLSDDNSVSLTFPDDSSYDRNDPTREFTDMGDLSLEIVRRYADYFYDYRVQYYRQYNRNRLVGLHNEPGGMKDALYRLYAITGDIKHRRGAEAFDEENAWRMYSRLAAGEDFLAGAHANTTIPKVTGALNRYTTLKHNPEFYSLLSDAERAALDTMYRPAAENFFDIVINNHSFITGGNSEWERFRTNEHMVNNINTGTTHETCNIYNMLKLTRELFKLNQDVKYADYYENAFINGILSSQHPETGEMMYFQPMGTGHFKFFGFQNFWCCTGSGIENWVKLGDSIYFVNGDRVYKNLYFSSELNYEERNLKLTSDSNLYFSDNTRPFSDTVSIAVGRIDETQPLGTVDLYLRVPGWTAGSPTVRLNGQVIADPAISEGYIILRANDGDAIELTFPMEVDFHSMHGNDKLMAFRYGPLVLSAGMGTAGMVEHIRPDPRPHIIADPHHRPIRPGYTTTMRGTTQGDGIMVWSSVRDPDAPSMINVLDITVAEWREDLANNLVRIPDAPMNEPLFRLNGTNMDDEFVFGPHYRKFNERYGVYFTFFDMTDTGLMQEIVMNNKRRNREVDGVVSALVNLDGHANEGDFIAELSGVRASSGNNTYEWNGRLFRESLSATADATIRYNMPVEPGVKNYLNTVLARADSGREWDIYINGQFLDVEAVTDNIAVGTDLDSNFYVMTRGIPIGLTPGTGLPEREFSGVNRPYITVEFRSRDGWLGRLFGLSISTRPVLLDTNPNLRDLTFSEGVLTPAFDPEIKEYTLTVPAGTQVTMRATPQTPSGIVIFNDLVIDDTQPFEVSVPGFVILETYAQNHLSNTKYTVSINGAPAPPPSPHLNPRVWYKMDEASGTTFADSSGNNHANGTVVNNAPFVEIDGLRGLDFGGGSQRHATLPLTIFQDVRGDFTLSFMTYFRSATNEWSRIIDFGPSSGSNIMFMRAGDMGFMMDNGSRLTPPSSQSNTNNANRWRLVTITRRDNITTIHLDGLAVVSGTQSSNANRTPSGTNFFIGRSNWGTGDGFANFAMRDLRLYSRAMNALDVSVLHGESQVTRAMPLMTLASVFEDGDTLPRTLAGFPLSWSSSIPGVIADDGFTVVVSSDVEQQVELTATVIGVEGLERTFNASIQPEQASDPITFLRLNLNAITRVQRNFTFRDIGISVNEGASSEGVILTVSNPAMATIGPDGRSVITSGRAGTVTLTATDPEDGLRHSVTLMIT